MFFRPLEDKACKKEVLKMVFNNICENNKYLSTLEKQVKDMTIENLSIVKSYVKYYSNLNKFIKKNKCNSYK